VGRPSSWGTRKASRPSGHMFPRYEEGVPVTPSPERPEQAPHDVPDPGPQAIAWARALQVVHGKPH
jgi:hypothetical protein